VGTSDPVLAVMRERVLQAHVERLLRVCGWRYYHTHDSRRSVAGFPDLVALRPPRFVVIELKSARGKLTAEQDAWLAAFQRLGAEVYVWRPSDLEVAARVLGPGA